MVAEPALTSVKVCDDFPRLQKLFSQLYSLLAFKAVFSIITVGENGRKA